MVNVFSNQSDRGGSFWLCGPWEGSEWGYPEQGVPKMLCISRFQSPLLLVVSVPCAGDPAVTWAAFCTLMVLAFPYPHRLACSVQLC